MSHFNVWRTHPICFLEVEASESMGPVKTPPCNAQLLASTTSQQLTIVVNLLRNCDGSACLATTVLASTGSSITISQVATTYCNIGFHASNTATSQLASFSIAGLLFLISQSQWSAETSFARNITQTCASSSKSFIVRDCIEHLCHNHGLLGRKRGRTHDSAVKQISSRLVELQEVRIFHPVATGQSAGLLRILENNGASRFLNSLALVGHGDSWLV